MDKIHFSLIYLHFPFFLITLYLKVKNSELKWKRSKGPSNIKQKKSFKSSILGEIIMATTTAATKIKIIQQ